MVGHRDCLSAIKVPFVGTIVQGREAYFAGTLDTGEVKDKSHTPSLLHTALLEQGGKERE